MKSTAKATAKRKAAEREDSLRNAALVRKAMAAHIKKHHVPPTVEDLVTATGLAATTVRLHRKRVKLGDGSPNVFQQLTPNVLMALYERAVGYSHPAVKILAVSQGKGEPSVVETHNYTEHYPPDAASAKLFLQTVEGWGEKTQHEHSGEVKNPGPPSIIQIIRHRPTDGNAE